jgi:hypothetical protein
MYCTPQLVRRTACNAIFRVQKLIICIYFHVYNRISIAQIHVGGGFAACVKCFRQLKMLSEIGLFCCPCGVKAPRTPKPQHYIRIVSCTLRLLCP